ncbi:MAG: hypothetical protein V3R64_07665 [Sphingomonadales bacterium]
MNKLKNLFIIFGSFLILLFASPSWAQDDVEFDKFRISMGVFFPSADTGVRLDASNGVFGTTIKFEDDLGVTKKKPLFRLDGYWRPKKRHALAFGYYDFERSGSNVISATINFGDQVFVINSLVESFFDIRVIKLAYTYFPVVKEKTLVGLSIGFNISDVDVGLGIDGINVAVIRSVSVPLPMVGFEVAQQLGGGFSVEGSFQFFYLDVGSEDARVFDGKITINYQITKVFGIGIGYNYFGFKMNKAKTNFTGRFQLHYDGVMGFLNFTF